MRLLLAVAIVSMSSVVFSASTKDVKEELQGVNREIQEKRQLLKNTAKTEEKISSDLERIEKTLSDKESKIRGLSSELRNVESGIDHTRQEMDSLNRELETKRLDIQRRLVSLYKAGDMGMVRIIFSSESFSDMLENVRYTRAVMEHDRKAIEAYNQRMEQLKGLKELMEREASRKEKIRAAIEQKKREVEGEQKKKAVYLAQVRKDKKGYQLSLRELEANAQRLQAMVEKLEAVARKSYIEKADKASHGGGAVKALPAFAGKGFRGQKGRLTLPVQGQVIGGFGRHKHNEFNAYTFSNGISVAAPSGADIHAVYDGRVIFADYFKGYGNMVIIDHGGGFYSLYAHASRLLKGVGSMVSSNDAVASVGDIDSTRGPMLYFELRYQGKPVDPTPWFRH